MGFQWDDAKDAANEAKHGIQFIQAVQIFRSPILKVRDDRHDYGEQRFVALGIFDGTVLSVAFTERDGDIRLISARKASKNERKIFEKHQKR